jgi:hypothetical protein
MSKSVIILLLVVAIAWIGVPYLTHATDQSASSPSFHAILLPTTNPSSAARVEESLAIVRGHPGFWRLAEDRSGVWWFLSPDDRLEFLNTVTTVQPLQLSRDRDGAHFVSRDWHGDTNGEGTRSELDQWAQATLTRVLDTGFKGLGAWCNPAFHRLDVPMSQDLNIWTWIDDASRRFYSPDWAMLAEHAVQTQVQPLQDNRNLFGYFIDNELDWGDGFAGPSAYFDNLPPNDPNRIQVIRVIRSLWPTPAEFNHVWKTHLSDWNEVDEWAVLPEEPASAYSKLSSAWLSHLAQDYFRCTTGLIHKYDPNHLILGVRFKGYAPEEVVAASRDFTDAQSLNYYVADAKLDAEMFRMMRELSGQPIVISEYSFHSMDGRSNDMDSVGFEAHVPDQQARADGYRLMTTRLARVPYIVGADWFQWCDEPPGGRSGDGEDVNFGVVDTHDRPYELLADAIRQTGPMLNSLHASSAADSNTDIWRDGYLVKPEMRIPFLVQAPPFNGDLGLWPAECKLAGMNRVQTVDMSRYPVATPNIYLGWNYQGLYLAVEVFDNQRVFAPANGWWWTRDHVEFWISTRSVTSNQNNYDPYCHQFFIVPGGKVSDGTIGVVGQWHRDGDALKDNLIPQPLIKNAMKIESDRYIAELFIPAAALHGFDPVHQPTLAFNIHVLDFEPAADFFWSAPKLVQTQLRPGTWGSLYLEPPAHAVAMAHPAQAQAN